jgi:anti-sigma regulatory factor (Ser/Thr protein kinase)
LKKVIKRVYNKKKYIIFLFLKNRYKISISAKRSFGIPLRKIAEKIFRRSGFSPRECFRLACVFDEIFLNALKYGTKKGSCVTVFFEWEWGNYVRVRVDDKGGRVLRTADQIRKYMLHQIKNTNPIKRSGRGLAQIVSKWSDTLHIFQNKKGGISVSFEKFLGKSKKIMMYSHRNPHLSSHNFS